MLGKTEIYTNENGTRHQFVIDTYAIRVQQEVIDVYYTRNTLAPLTEDVIKAEQKQYSITGQEFEDWRNKALSDLVSAGVTTVEEMFFLASLPKIIAIENSNNGN